MTKQQIILPAVTLSVMPDGRVWCYLPGEPGKWAFVGETELAAAVRGMIKKKEKKECK